MQVWSLKALYKQPCVADNYHWFHVKSKCGIVSVIATPITHVHSPLCIITAMCVIFDAVCKESASTHTNKLAMGLSWKHTEEDFMLVLEGFMYLVHDALV